jgi:hypothetical protein
MLPRPGNLLADLHAMPVCYIVCISQHIRKVNRIKRTCANRGHSAFLLSRTVDLRWQEDHTSRYFIAAWKLFTVTGTPHETGAIVAPENRIKTTTAFLQQCAIFTMEI